MSYEQVTTPERVLRYIDESVALRAAIGWLHDNPFGRVTIDQQGSLWALRRFRRVVSPDADVRMIREPVVVAESVVDWSADDWG